MLLLCAGVAQGGNSAAAERGDEGAEGQSQAKPPAGPIILFAHMCVRVSASSARHGSQRTAPGGARQQ